MSECRECKPQRPARARRACIQIAVGTRESGAFVHVNVWKPALSSIGPARSNTELYKKALRCEQHTHLARGRLPVIVPARSRRCIRGQAHFSREKAWKSGSRCSLKCTLPLTLQRLDFSCREDPGILRFVRFVVQFDIYFVQLRHCSPHAFKFSGTLRISFPTQMPLAQQPGPLDGIVCVRRWNSISQDSCDVSSPGARGCLS